MKTVLLILLFAATASADPGNDGTFWQTLPRNDRLAWAMGWLEGTTASEALFGVTPAQAARVKNWNGTTCNELAEGSRSFTRLTIVISGCA